MGEAYTTTLAEFGGGMLRQPIADAIAAQPRSQQVQIGPSELGTTCARCLVERLAGIKHPPAHLPWLPFVGTAVHAALEGIFHGLGEPGEWLTETRVTVGEVDGRPITGSADLYHLPSGSVCDWKVAGRSTREQVAEAGRSKPVYRVQAALYGMGFAALGLPVHRTAVVYLPREHMLLDKAVVAVEEFDDDARALASWALSRASVYAKAIRLGGVEAVLAGVGPHTGAEFACKDALAVERRPTEGSTDLLAS